MRNFIDAVLIAAVFAAISFGTAVLQERRYQKELFSDRDTGCIYVGTQAGGYTLMMNADGSPQCEEGLK